MWIFPSLEKKELLTNYFMKKSFNTNLVLTSAGDHFLLHHCSRLTSTESNNSAPPFPFSPTTTTRTPRPSKLRAVSGPMPLRPPGPKSTA